VGGGERDTVWMSVWLCVCNTGEDVLNLYVVCVCVKENGRRECVCVCVHVCLCVSVAEEDGLNVHVVCVCVNKIDRERENVRMCVSFASVADEGKKKKRPQEGKPPRVPPLSEGAIFQFCFLTKFLFHSRGEP